VGAFVQVQDVCGFAAECRLVRRDVQLRSVLTREHGFSWVSVRTRLDIAQEGILPWPVTTTEPKAVQSEPEIATRRRLEPPSSSPVSHSAHAATIAVSSRHPDQTIAHSLAIRQPIYPSTAPGATPVSISLNRTQPSLDTQTVIRNTKDRLMVVLQRSAAQRNAGLGRRISGDQRRT